MQRCEDCKFIRLAKYEEDKAYMYATCKASKPSITMQRVSKVFDNDEQSCTSRRDSDTCPDYLEKDHEL
jgi:hypothetical protein